MGSKIIQLDRRDFESSRCENEPRKSKSSHLGYFGIYIKKEFRNLRIGTHLISKIIEIARQIDFKIIQLSVFASNKRVIHIYEKFGFQEVGE
ncbi:MAG: GNAT family N-acetyltransferase [Candidatus Bathyarchaeia archaeon]